MSIHFVNANGCQCEKYDFPPKQLSANLGPTVDFKDFTGHVGLHNFLDRQLLMAFQHLGKKCFVLKKK